MTFGKPKYAVGIFQVHRSRILRATTKVQPSVRARQAVPIGNKSLERLRKPGARDPSRLAAQDPPGDLDRVAILVRLQARAMGNP